MSSQTKLSVFRQSAGGLSDGQVRDVVDLINQAFGVHRWLFPADRTSECAFRQEVGGRELIMLYAAEPPTLVGTASIHPEGDALFVGMVAVRPHMHRRGIGDRLLQIVERIAYEQQKAALRLTAVRQVGNIAYFQHRGFRIIHEQRQPAGTWHAVQPFHLALLERAVQPEQARFTHNHSHERPER